MSEHILQLLGYLQTYDWGRGKDSIIHTQLGGRDDSEQYAELWFGNHPSGPSELIGVDKNLREALADNPAAVLGDAVVAEYGNDLPFLFKVLSVGRPLSIQAHPNSEQAVELHSADPRNYPDSYPKPEVGIAISPVRILYGFRSLEEMLENIQEVPELAALVGDSRDSIEAIYRAVCTAPIEQVQAQSKLLNERISSNGPTTSEEEFILDLQEHYPDGDVGLFSFYLLNLVTIQPGEALYIGSNIAHAYLDGELIECMAPSDNVVRAGLTSKYVDVDTLLDIVEYAPQPPDLLASNETGIAGYTEYPVPLDKFFRIGTFQPGGSVTVSTEGKVELLFCLFGGAAIRGHNDAFFELTSGSALLVTGSVVQYQVDVKKESQVFRVSVPK